MNKFISRYIALFAIALIVSGCGSKKSTTKDSPINNHHPIAEETEEAEANRNIHHGSSIPKHEFRGAWIQIVNGQFQGKSRDQLQKILSYQLDELQKDGVNAIIFQVRGECDAFYPSRIEPWSRFLTGRQGVAPNPYWDPLQWMIDQCHQRGMELHAWINPYRAKMKSQAKLAPNHIAITHPERFFKYDGLYILNPALPKNREYICNVVDDILRRYDVDGLHIDDYFYPYPVSGVKIPDDKEFYKYNNGIDNKADWRRYNVDLFIKQLSDSIKRVKPWVKFGVSPFGIYRNKRSSEIGSNTNGLQNYDDLYADVLKWVNNGWIDYCVPQLYWQIGHKSADYKELINWWNQHASARPLYIGEDVERTIKYADPDNPQSNQVPAKHKLHREMKNVSGTVLWYAKAAVDNYDRFGTFLRNYYWKYPALQPSMPFKNTKSPHRPTKLKTKWEEDGLHLVWDAPKATDWQDQACQYVVYRFAKGEIINIDDPSHIVAITRKLNILLPYKDGKSDWTYIVSAIGRTGNESPITKRSVEL